MQEGGDRCAAETAAAALPATPIPTPYSLHLFIDAPALLFTEI